MKRIGFRCADSCGGAVRARELGRLHSPRSYPFAVEGAAPLNGSPSGVDVSSARRSNKINLRPATSREDACGSPSTTASPRRRRTLGVTMISSRPASYTNVAKQIKLLRAHITRRAGRHHAIFL